MVDEFGPVGLRDPGQDLEYLATVGVLKRMADNLG